ncbi:MAG TPA: asparaginase [Acidimicrobiales bacterium]|nr:asparaginase [Acidimicrobiales bacterium]
MTLLLLATGGTIASKVQPDGGVAVALTGSELLSTVPDLDPTEVEVVDVSHGPSWNFDLDAMHAIAVRARQGLTTGATAGVVVTHGTDTVEETLWMTDLVAGDLTERGAIVFTAAMRNAGQPDADGPTNLRDACTLASSPEARGRGALLCVDGEVHEARWVTKTDSQSLDTFKSFGGRPWTCPAVGLGIESRIAIIRSYGGIDGDIVEWHVQRGVRGLVIEGGGAGNVAGTLVSGLERAVAGGVPVVVVTRCLTGAVAPIYGGPGGGHTLESIGVIGGSDLNASKARVALAVAMGVDPSVAAVRAWFEELG